MALTLTDETKLKKLLEIEKLKKDKLIKEKELSDGLASRADECKLFQAGIETEIQDIEKQIETLKEKL